MALCCQASDLFTIEEMVKHGPNVMTFQLQTGNDATMSLGRTFPHPMLARLTTSGRHGNNARRSARRGSSGTSPSICSTHGDERDEEIAEECAFMGLTNLSRHFLPS